MSTRATAAPDDSPGKSAPETPAPGNPSVTRYSASEAIWPALARTWGYLFRAFKVETFFKLAVIATLSEGFLVTWQFWTPNAFPFDVDLAAAKIFLLKPAFLPVTILAAIAIFLAGLCCSYLDIQLRFAFIHSLIHQTRAIRPAVRLYAAEAERFFTAWVLVWLSFMVLAVLALVAVVIAGYGVYATPTPDGKLDLGHFFILFVPCFCIGVALLVAACLAQIVLNDFILPHMAIEGTSFRKAWAEVRMRISANRETFLSFLILRLLIPFFAGILLAAIGWLISWLVFGLLGMSAAGFNAMLDNVASPDTWLRIPLGLLFTLLGIAAGCIITVALGGPLGVFMRSYALCFYGGHYKALGNLLEPPRV